MRKLFPLFLALIFVISLVGICHAQSVAKQLSKAVDPSQSESTKEPPGPPPDPLGRSTPRGTVLGFLQAAQAGDYKAAANYLQLTRSQRATEGERLARDLHILMDRAYMGRVSVISQERQGSGEGGVPSDHERIGVFQVDSSEYDVLLAHVLDPPAGEVWLFSSTTLRQVPDLAQELEVKSIETVLPSFLVSHKFLSAPLWIWLAVLLLLPISYGVAWSAIHLVRRIKRAWDKWRHRPEATSTESSLAPAAILIVADLVHQVSVTYLGLPLLYRLYYYRAAGIVLVSAVGWLIFRGINRWAERERIKAILGTGIRQGSLILLGQRIFKVLVAIAMGLAILGLLNVNMTTAIAGLGITSLAIAFAAQKTLENLFGGIMVLSDEVIRVGETCRLGDKVGTVEDISLRSTRIRTTDRVELSVPNGVLANMNIENLSRRDKNLFHTKISLRYETTPGQLRSVISNLSTLLINHPKVDPTVRRVRFIGFAESSLDLEIFALILTRDYDEFMQIREGLLLKIMDLVSEAGTSFAFPSRMLYLMQDSAQERSNRDSTTASLAIWPPKS